MTEIPAISLQYLTASITADVTLDDQVVALALMADSTGSPGADDWTTATWVGDAGTTRSARILVGPGGDFTPSVGGYTVYGRVTNDPEIPVMKVGWVRFV